MGDGEFLPGDNLLLIDEKSREYLISVPEPGKPLPLKGELIAPELFHALHDGELLITPQRRRYLAFRPTMAETVMNMPRAAQVIYPKDLGLMLHYGDAAPGQRVIEVGCGHGALTMALLRVLGPEGRLTSFDLRLDHLNRTRKNIARFLGPDALEGWEPRKADIAAEGCGLTGQDRAFVDVPEPWELLPALAEALRPGGVLVAYVPTVPQLAHVVEDLGANRDFSLAVGFETLQRFWHVRPPSVRPAHFMKAHTGFVITARRRWRQAPAETPAPEPAPSESEG